MQTLTRCHSLEQSLLRADMVCVLCLLSASSDNFVNHKTFSKCPFSILRVWMPLISSVHFPVKWKDTKSAAWPKLLWLYWNILNKNSSEIVNFCLLQSFTTSVNICFRWGVNTRFLLSLGPKKKRQKKCKTFTSPHAPLPCDPSSSESAHSTSCRHLGMKRPPAEGCAVTMWKIYACTSALRWWFPDHVHYYDCVVDLAIPQLERE